MSASRDELRPEFEITAETSRRIALVRQHLAPTVLGTKAADVVSIVCDIGGLQDGWHLYELWNRIRSFEPSWFEHALSQGRLCPAHVLRVALRYVSCDDLPKYFQGTREVIRTRMSHGHYPAELSSAHEQVLAFVRERGPLSPRALKQALGVEATRLFYELYHRGDVMRFGRKNGKPLYAISALRQPPIALQSIPEAEAHEWLFLKGLEAFGPLTAREVAHWVGWRMNTAKQTLTRLVAQGRVTRGSIASHAEAVWTRTEDVDRLEDIAGEVGVEPFVRILFNDDELLLGLYPRLGSLFGYPWTYPQFSRGEFLRPAILVGTELAGDLDLNLRAKSSTLAVKSMRLRPAFQSAVTRRLIRERLTDLAQFAEKQLAWDGSYLTSGSENPRTA